ncbi:MAG: hypothetical protein ABIG84_06795 [archaeon]
MEMWDKDYFNMEVQAYIKIEKSKRGEFQFGLVWGAIDGRIVNHPGGKRFEFTWVGNEECDGASGSGWFMLKGADEIRGKIRIHDGDSSGFKARRAALMENNNFEYDYLSKIREAPRQKFMSGQINSFSKT